MPTSLTLKNIPDDVYDRLKASAQRNHRSLNSEVMACLETVLLPTKVPPENRSDQAYASSTHTAPRSDLLIGKSKLKAYINLSEEKYASCKHR